MGEGETLLPEPRSGRGGRLVGRDAESWLVECVQADEALRLCGCAPRLPRPSHRRPRAFQRRVGDATSRDGHGRARFARAGVLKGAGNLAWNQGDYKVARSLL